MNKNNQYCTCNHCSSITTGFEDEFGYWEVCGDCGKKLEMSYHFYNHFDGEDHEDLWE